MCKVLKEFTKGNARKSTVNFAFSGYADVIKYQEKTTFSSERAQIIEARISSARSHKTIGSHLKELTSSMPRLSEVPMFPVPS